MKIRPMLVISLVSAINLAFFQNSMVAAEVPPAPSKAAVSIFDGKSLDGWEGDPKIWRIQEGVITGGSLTEMIKRNEFLATTKEYSNFIVRLRIKLTGTEGFLNSGFQIRSQRVPGDSEMSGYQCDFGDPGWWGCIYDESRRNKLMAQSDMKILEPVLKRNDWNEYVIRADGPRITTWINGVQGVDYTEADPAITQTGRMGRERAQQVHFVARRAVGPGPIVVLDDVLTTGSTLAAAAFALRAAGAVRVEGLVVAYTPPPGSNA